ncbi:MAG: MBL fold metallo-hydrolase [Sphaerochaetaceae bacterium]
MKITYIHHSCFVVEAINCTILFDYYKGKLPSFREDKPLYVLSSHRHPDHFSDKIFLLGDQYKDVFYILSSDIDNNKRVPERFRKVTTFMHPGQEMKFGRFWVNCYKSTDEGVAFAIDVFGTSFYHAGDLNDWYWEGESQEDNIAMQRRYLKEVSLLDDHFDVAFVPVDPRLGKYYSLGAKEFLDHCSVDHLFPMHFWDDFSVCKKLQDELGRPVEQIEYKNQEFEVE